jgi:hypothetical protein
MGKGANRCDLVPSRSFFHGPFQNCERVVDQIFHGLSIGFLEKIVEVPEARNLSTADSCGELVLYATRSQK